MMMETVNIKVVVLHKIYDIAVIASTIRAGT
jgi:hypothetical protein